MISNPSARGLRRRRHPLACSAALGMALLLPSLAAASPDLLSWEGSIAPAHDLSFGVMPAGEDIRTAPIFLRSGDATGPVAAEPEALPSRPSRNSRKAGAALTASARPARRPERAEAGGPAAPAEPGVTVAAQVAELSLPQEGESPAEPVSGPFALPDATDLAETPVVTKAAELPGLLPDIAPVAPSVSPAEPAGAVAPLRTADIKPEKFAAARSASLSLIAEREASGADPLEDRIEHARILLAGMFLPEARAAIEEIAGLRSAPLPEAMRLEIGAIALAVEILGGKPVKQAALARGARWEDARLWPALDAWLRDQSRPDATAIRAAAGALSEQSLPVATAALPLLFDEALGIRDAALAEELLMAGLQATDLPGSSRFLLMQGRLAELQGDERKAFDLMAAAMEHRDIDGIRARIALVDMVLSRQEVRFLPRLREILAEGVDQWRGDELARHMLIRLAQVTEDLGDDISALRTMMRIQASFPETREASLAGERIPAILSRLAANAERDAIPFETFLTAMREFEPTLSGMPGWVDARHVLARMLTDKGMNRAAAAEYRAIRTDIFGGASTVSADGRDRLIVEEAEAAERAGQWEQLRAVLALPVTGQDPQVIARLGDVVARNAATEAGGIAGLVDPVPAEADRLEAGRAAIRADDPAAALAAYDAHLSRGQRLPPEDIPAYLRAQARVVKNGNMEETARRLGMGSLDARAIAAEAAGRTPVAVKPLSTEKARAVLDQSEKAAKAAEDLLGSES